MEKCYQGIDIPEQIQEPCGNTYISTNCVSIPGSLIYLDIPSGSSQTEVNNKIMLALQSSYQAIQELTARVIILENNQ